MSASRYKTISHVITTAATIPTLRFINRQRQIRLCLLRLKKMTAQALPYCLAHRGGPGAILSALPTVEITIVSDKRIASLHERFFEDPTPTDVITFPHGEIIISAETAATNGRQYGHSPTVEVALCIIHGLLHLNGYNDTTAVSAAKMERKQKNILGLVY